MFAPSPMIGLIVFVTLGIMALLGFLIGQKRSARTDASPAPAAPRRPPAPPLSGPTRGEAQLRQEFALLSSSVLGMAERIECLARQQQQTAWRLDELELTAANGGAYTPAIKMAERGCEVEELVHNFGLPRAEAELLRKLHGANDPDQSAQPRSRAAVRRH